MRSGTIIGMQGTVPEKDLEDKKTLSPQFTCWITPGWIPNSPTYNIIPENRPHVCYQSEEDAK